MDHESDREELLRLLAHSLKLAEMAGEDIAACYVSMAIDILEKNDKLTD